MAQSARLPGTSPAACGSSVRGRMVAVHRDPGADPAGRARSHGCGCGSRIWSSSWPPSGRSGTTSRVCLRAYGDRELFRPFQGPLRGGAAFPRGRVRVLRQPGIQRPERSWLYAWGVWHGLGPDLRFPAHLRRQGAVNGDAHVPPGPGDVRGLVHAAWRCSRRRACTACSSCSMRAEGPSCPPRGCWAGAP